MSDAYIHSVVLMGTVVTVEIIGHGASEAERRDRADGIGRALEWFRQVESCCTRFDAESESRRATRVADEVTVLSPMLFEAVHFAMLVARETDGVFDPTVGAAMERRGFDREYRSGEQIAPATDAYGAVSFRDVELDSAQRTMRVRRPLILDLGAVAKGMAVDLAARELAPFRNFAIDAGGDVFTSGHNAAGAAWVVGVKHPRRPGALIGTLTVSDAAVCTSGDYERVSPRAGEGHHIMDARTGRAASAVASVTVMAPSAMVADALATAAFALGPDAGTALLERQGVEGVLITPALDEYATPGMHLHRVTS